MSSRSPRQNSGSGARSFHGSQSFNPSASMSRPFLNMLNPMNRAYQGYSQANQSLLEEDERSGDEHSDVDVESARGGRDKRVSWDAGASEMNVLHPNIHKEDAQDSSDDEVPQSFMIETSTTRKPSTKGKQKQQPPQPQRTRPLQSAGGRKLPPVLPTHRNSPVSVPPRPSELHYDDDDEHTPRPSDVYGQERPRPQMRGLDDYERALWNWVNVYNLDAFLQDVYYYYEGKGMYTIALSRGLNLLFVFSCHFRRC